MNFLRRSQSSKIWPAVAAFRATQLSDAWLYAVGSCCWFRCRIRFWASGPFGRRVLEHYLSTGVESFAADIA